MLQKTGRTEKRGKKGHVVREVEQSDPDGYKRHPDYEKRGQDRSGGQDGLPGRQALLLESTVCDRNGNKSKQSPRSTRMLSSLKKKKTYSKVS